MNALARNLGMLLLLGSASAAPAQIKPEAPLGTRIPVKPQAVAAPETRSILAEFAQCTVKKHRDLAVQFILDASKINVAKDYMKLADGNCMTGVADAQERRSRVDHPP